MLRNSLLGRVPLLIEDAIEVTKKLGFRYIWIDRYCIPQDNEAEKYSQIQNMGVIYQQSALTLVAAAGDGPSYGLPGVSCRVRKRQPSVDMNTVHFISTISVHKELTESTWNTRGWTYQEGLLSSRRLVFTDSQVYFQCNAMRCVESISLPLKSLHTSNHQRFRTTVRVPRLFPPWRIGKDRTSFGLRVNEFWQRILSRDGDALAPFSGILVEFERLENPIYHLHGMPIFAVGKWSNTFAIITGLTWYVIEEEHQPMQRRSESPSWTWVGWKPGSVSQRIGWHSWESSILLEFDTSMSIKVEFKSGTSLEWEGNLQEIIQTSKSGDLATVLEIHGSVFDIHIPVTMRSQQGWEYQDCFIGCYKIRRRDATRLLQIAENCGFPKSASGDHYTFTCWAMWLPLGKSCVAVMVLSQRATQPLLERVDRIQLTFTEPETWDNALWTYREDATWTKKVIRIG
jgi:hypothetical protein